MDEKRYIKRKEKALADGNRDQLALSCNHLGDYFNQQGKYSDAVKEYQQEAEIYNKLGKKLEMAKAHRMVGEMFMLLSEFDSAKEHINIYLKAVKRLQNKVEEQRAFATLGRVHLMHGQSLSDVSASKAEEQIKLAEKSFLRSLLLIKELSGQTSKLEQFDMQARCYLNLGVVKEHREEFEESIAYIEKAIKISKQNDLFELTHLCYISMSLFYHLKNHDPTLALRYCNFALDVAKRLPNKVKKICETLITKSSILLKEGDFASAKQILTKAYKKNTPDENDRNSIEKTLRVVVKICQSLDELVTTSSNDYATRKNIFEKLGDGCCHLQIYEKALDYYQKMLECAKQNAETGKQLTPIYVSLYQTYKDNKQYDKALEYLWKEYDLNKDVPVEAFSTLCTIGDVCELQRQPFWTIQDIYMKAKEQAAKAENSSKKLERIAYARLRKLQMKHKMNTLVVDLEEEARSKGIDVSSLDDDSESESDALPEEHNTPELGKDVCLDDLTDSDTSDLDETEKHRPHRATRGTRSLTIKRNNKGETQLHQACITGNAELVRRLIEQGHVVNVRDHAGWIPLHEACNHGFRDIVEMLLDRGAISAINDKGGTSCEGITPLYDACSNGYLDVVELLLERGADATLKTDFGETCLSALDNWRSTAKLDESEQALYVQLRASMLKRLSKVGICSADAMPLTNQCGPCDENSTEKQMSSKDDGDDDDIENYDMHELTKSCSRHSRSFDKDNEKSATRHSNAGQDYKTVMQQLKHPNRSSPVVDELYLESQNRNTAASKQKRSALLDSDDIDVDSWLIDDIGPEKKKRKFSVTTPTKRNRSLNKSTSNENLNDSPIHGRDLDSFTPERDAFEILLYTAGAGTSTMQQRKKQVSKLSLPRSSSMTSNSSLSGYSRNCKPKHQASLLDSGFCRFRSESPISSEESSDAAFRSIEPDSTTSIQLLITSPVKSSPSKHQATLIVAPTVSFKIKVEDELLLVPIERKKLNDINIRWLAEEAARRYYNTVGLKPVLRLKTSDGFAYEENDAVNVAVEENMILATVVEWKISPLPQRYEEMCQQLKQELKPEVVAVLEKAQLTNVIQFSNYWLTPKLTEPIFKCILHQNTLLVLDLSNNCIQNEGCRQLSKSLPTLKQLKTLNLRGNFITADGLDALSAGACFEKLEELVELNLSQNPLGNNSLRILEKLCKTTSNTLQKLHLSHCGITNFYEYDLNFFSLIEFDISYNQLSDETLKKLLAKLNSCRLQYLNLNFTRAPAAADNISHTETAERIVEFLESGTCDKVKNFQLVGCDLSDSNMFRIAQCLSKANDIDILDISENIKLSAATMKYILQEMPQLKKFVALNCTRLIQDGSFRLELVHTKRVPQFMAITLNGDANTKSENEEFLRSFWHSQWGDKGKIKLCGPHIKLYINEKDVDNF